MYVITFSPPGDPGLLSQQPQIRVARPAAYCRTKVTPSHSGSNGISEAGLGRGGLPLPSPPEATPPGARELSAPVTRSGTSSRLTGHAEPQGEAGQPRVRANHTNCPPRTSPRSPCSPPGLGGPHQASAAGSSPHRAPGAGIRAIEAPSKPRQGMMSTQLVYQASGQALRQQVPGFVAVLPGASGESGHVGRWPGPTPASDFLNKTLNKWKRHVPTVGQ
ncbi:hypothetical protein NDU88_006705 [Pleurodeles waltl]|uniref:Uncharacterized protein n=1 Tax=Pleurodeles waltl TaxID=8319 RepID=A0AAV7MET2_PLEWA|nr:hypothetical protein NDU88_006705 [Pleurodeles waltl]